METITPVLPRNHMRWMIRRDMPEVLLIDGQEGSDWCEEDFLRCLRQRNCIGMVAEQGERIVGFMVYELHGDHLVVLNFGVRRRYRRSGVGRQMLMKLVSKLSSHRRTHVEVPASDERLGVHLWLKACGFTAVRVEGSDYVFEFRVPS